MGVPLLPPEIIGRIVAFSQPRHNPLLDSERKAVFQTLALIGKDWYYYAKKEFDRWLLIRVYCDSRQAPLEPVDVRVNPRLRFVRVAWRTPRGPRDSRIYDGEAKNILGEVYKCLTQFLYLKELWYAVEGDLGTSSDPVYDNQSFALGDLQILSFLNKFSRKFQGYFLFELRDADLSCTPCRRTPSPSRIGTILSNWFFQSR